MERGLGRTRVAIRLNESITEAVPRKSKTRRCRAHRREGAAVGLDGSGAGWDGGVGLDGKAAGRGRAGHFCALCCCVRGFYDSRRVNDCHAAEGLRLSGTMDR